MHFINPVVKPYMPYMLHIENESTRCQFSRLKTDEPNINIIIVAKFKVITLLKFGLISKIEIILL